MKKLFSTVVAVVCYVFIGSISADAQNFGLKVNDYSIESISPDGFRAVNGALKVNVTNGNDAFTLTGISGRIYKNGRPFVEGSCGDVIFPAGTSSVVVRGHASLSSGIGLWDVLKCVWFTPSDYTFDISLVYHASDGSVTPISKVAVPLSSVLSR